MDNSTPTRLFNPLPFNCPKHPARGHRLRVRAVGSLNPASWWYVITDENRPVIARDMGFLPAYYDGLRWSPATATLYALAQAKRFIDAQEPQNRVTMICTEPRTEQGRGTRWAA
jgi:hypothetical protein